jgi:hypothetical protein
MEPITTTVVAAFVAGAVAAAKDVSTSAIKDAYQGLKRLITDRYSSAKEAIAGVEAKPDSDQHRVELAKRLESGGGARDVDLKTAAQTLLDAVEELRGVESAAPLFDFDRLRVARNLELSDIEALGPVFKARDAEIQGDFKASGIRQTGRSKKN